MVKRPFDGGNDPPMSGGRRCPWDRGYNLMKASKAKGRGVGWVTLAPSGGQQCGCITPGTPLTLL